MRSLTWFASSATGRDTSSSPNSNGISLGQGASMSEISAAGYAVALHPVATRLLGLGERGDRLQAELDSRIVEQAKRAVSARLDTTTDVAFELLAGLARSQGR